MNLRFTKMNGAGNDFVLLDNREGKIRLTPDQIIWICDRHRGIGADGILLLESATTEEADFYMRYYNSDGKEAEMCGNGARCFARFSQHILSESAALPIPKRISFETPAGIIHSQIFGDQVELQMSTPYNHSSPTFLPLKNGPCEVHFLNTGVPHAVVFVEDVEEVDVPGQGAELRMHPHFSPQGANANFVQILASDHLRMRTYERGVEAETLACGTGAVAVALLYHLRSKVPSPIRVTVQGGETLEISFNNSPPFAPVFLVGPADFVFEGSVKLSV